MAGFLATKSLFLLLSRQASQFYSLVVDSFSVDSAPEVVDEEVEDRQKQVVEEILRDPEQERIRKRYHRPLKPRYTEEMKAGEVWNVPAIVIRVRYIPEGRDTWKPADARETERVQVEKVSRGLECGRSARYNLRRIPRINYRV